MLRAFLLALTLCIGLPAFAQNDTLDEDIIAERTEAISRTLRCVVCQNQSIADSNAPLAEDMRNLVEFRVRQGDSDEEVRAYLQESYGDFVLMKPPFKPETYLLWFGPALFFFAGLSWFILSLSRKPVEDDEDDI